MSIKAAFMTGSRVYGKPTEASDWDIVLRCDREDATAAFGIPQTMKNEESGEYPLDEQGHQFKRGDVNFILCFTDARFESWQKGTEKLKLIAPVSRHVAVALFKENFAAEPKLATRSAEGAGR